MQHQRLIFFLLLTLLPTQALAFPEMVRHGYPNCTACHLSPSGGGVLSDYGRELSRELLAAWKSEDEDSVEQEALHGLVEIPEWLSLGGDLRGLQLVRDTPELLEGRVISMQADLEARVEVGPFALSSTAGWQATREEFLSRRHWAQYQAMDELSFRAGRFFPAFGIMLPDHIIATRQGLGFDQEMESYNLETSWLAEDWSVFATAILGRPDDTSLDREKGVALTPAVHLGKSYKIGLNWLYGTRTARGTNRYVTGLYGILGFTSNLYLLTEVDLQGQTSTSTGDRSWGWYHYQRLGYEPWQGFHLFVSEEISRPLFSNQGVFGYGSGIQFFPRPHFEITGFIENQVTPQFPGEVVHVGWLLFHYYL